MSTSVWGPKLWYVLHLMTFNYPEIPNEYDKRHFHDFFVNLQYVLPCMKCRYHYRQTLEKYPISPHLDNKTSLVKWLIDIHNQVNISTGKPIKSYNEVLQEYKNEMENTKTNIKTTNFPNIKYLFIPLIILLIMYIIYYYLKHKKKIIYIGKR